VNVNLLLIFGMTLMMVMGVSSITPAFPRIMEDLHLTKSQVGMLITLFSLPGVFFALPLGIAADRFGRKRVIVPCLLLFGLAGTACAFTRDFRLLLVLRFFQGLGATAAGVLNPTIIGDVYTGKERTVAMSYNIGVLNVGTASFPVIGGALALLGWQYPFLLPIAAIPLGLAVLFLMDTPEPRDFLNTREYLRSALLAATDRKALGLFFITLVTFVVSYGSYLTFFPLLLHSSFDASSFAIGLIMAVTSLSTLVTTTKIGWFVRRWRERELMVAGFVCYTIAMLMFPFVPVFWAFVVPTLIYGFGSGINSPSAQSILVGLAPEDARAGFLSVNSMILRVGQTLGPLLMGIVIDVWGMNGVFYAGAIGSLAMMTVTRTLLR
jgi:MFS family permease